MEEYGDCATALRAVAGGAAFGRATVDPPWRSRIRLCPVKGRNETKTIRDKRAKMAAPASPPSRLVPLHANDAGVKTAAGSVQNMTRVLRHTLSTTDGTTPTRCVAVAYGLDHSLRAPYTSFRRSRQREGDIDGGHVGEEGGMMIYRSPIFNNGVVIRPRIERPPRHLTKTFRITTITVSHAAE
ncbi:hypothetical protein BD626DRAFT_530480 [Schizophyllum amplum]|uniref:Uncharacterized protein n=1 Tax=Schizophyllum amplum TaxID=97359 RepID=A0A550BRS2_9AGAR|nr:hypothetical protein BD626DRAFT_530480 [Auriculariopsis ampla]